MENKNGQGIFYGVIGVATLVVAIIGATFAYFSASANVTGGDNVIKGGSNDALGGALTATVEKINLGGTAATDNLVPTNIASNSEIGLVKGAVTDKCVKGGYTGCHLYRVTASTSQDVANAVLTLSDLKTTNTKNPSDWQYIVLSGAKTDTGNTVTTNSLALLTPGKSGSMVKTADDFTPVEIHNAAMTTTDGPYVYYILIFLHDDDAAQTGEAQNSGGDNDATGTYTGVITLTAAGGKVTTTFTATA